MAKLILNDITSGYNSASAQNANNALLEASLENTVSRDGSSPNAMAANFDMGGFEIINLDAPTNSNSAARLQDIEDAATLSVSTAVLTTITDSGSNFASSNVEGALAELADGTALPIGSSTVVGIVEIATDAEAQALVDTSRVLTPSSLATVMASTTSQGLVELATNAEALAKTDATRAITAATVVPTFTDYAGGRSYYLNDGTLYSTAYIDIPASFSGGIWETIGPTGSVGNGSDPHNVFTALDIIPTGATAIICNIHFSVVKDATPGNLLTYISATNGDQTTSAVSTRRIVYSYKQFTAAEAYNHLYTDIVIPVNATNTFRIAYNTTSSAGSITSTFAELTIKGFLL